MAAAMGVQLALEPVCRNHSAPLDFLVEQIVDRPSLTLWHGPRGGGKSLLSGLACHLDSVVHDRHDTLVLGGSLAQSRQIYESLQYFDEADPDASPFRSFSQTKAVYRTGSTVRILAASPAQVRGPHVASLKLDEVDEIDPDIRESSFGTCMDKRGVGASVVMTSTWHRTGGPMAELMERGAAGEFPVHSFCIFEVLETCPDERSGVHLEKCGECPLKPWCHSEFAPDPLEPGRMLPKAKRSYGHYAIDALIQKVRGVSKRVLESDYLCSKPKAAGVWFPEFDDGNVNVEAEWRPNVRTHCSIDCGVWTGAVLFQVFKENDGSRRIHVFGEYLAEGVQADVAAMAILDVVRERAGDAKANGLLRVSVDSAAGHRNPVGATIHSIFEAKGLVGSEYGRLESWDKYSGSVQDTLTLLEGLIKSADGVRSLLIHPRCRHTISALQSYQRKKLGGQLTDQPVDPQHPAEEMVDALRGGLAVEYPRRMSEGPKLRRVHASRIF